MTGPVTEVRSYWMHVALGLKEAWVERGNRIDELEAEVERLRAELAAAEWAARHVYQREPTPDEIAHAMMLERDMSHAEQDGAWLAEDALLRGAGG